MTTQQLEKKIDSSTGWYIKEIDNPSDSIQLYAFARNPNVIREIKNPCNLVLNLLNNCKEIRKDVLSWGSNIKHIYKPTSAEQIRVIEQNLLNYYYIEKPSKKAREWKEKFESITQDYDTLLNAIKKDGLNLKYTTQLHQYITLVDPHIIIEAIKQNSDALNYYNCVEEDFDTNTVNEFILADKELAKKMIKIDPYFFYQIENPSREYQLLILDSIAPKDRRWHFEGLVNIKNPIEEVVNFLNKHGY